MSKQFPEMLRVFTFEKHLAKYLSFQPIAHVPVSLLICLLGWGKKWEGVQIENGSLYCYWGLQDDLLLDPWLKGESGIAVQPINFRRSSPGIWALGNTLIPFDERLVYAATD